MISGSGTEFGKCRRKERDDTHLGCPAGNDDSSSRDATCDDLGRRCAWTSKSPGVATAVSPQRCRPVCHRQPRSRPLFLKRLRKSRVNRYERGHDPAIGRKLSEALFDASRRIYESLYGVINRRDSGKNPFREGHRGE